MRELTLVTRRRVTQHVGNRVVSARFAVETAYFFGFNKHYFRGQTAVAFHLAVKRLGRPYDRRGQAGNAPSRRKNFKKIRLGEGLTVKSARRILFHKLDIAVGNSAVPVVNEQNKVHVFRRNARAVAFVGLRPYDRRGQAGNAPSRRKNFKKIPRRQTPRQAAKNQIGRNIYSS